MKWSVMVPIFRGFQRIDDVFLGQKKGFSPNIRSRVAPFWSMTTRTMMACDTHTMAPKGPWLGRKKSGASEYLQWVMTTIKTRSHYTWKKMMYLCCYFQNVLDKVLIWYQTGHCSDTSAGFCFNVIHCPNHLAQCWSGCGPDILSGHNRELTKQKKLYHVWKPLGKTASMWQIPHITE